MNLDEFKQKCIKRKEDDLDLKDDWNRLYEDQEKYGECYKPIMTRPYFPFIPVEVYRCPVCNEKGKYLEIESFVYDEKSDYKYRKFYKCNDCGYKYAGK